jgi:hypothetical protein
MAPIALTDQQLHELRQLAEAILRPHRGEFLQRVAQLLEACGGEIGDGAVHAAGVRAQREMLRVGRAAEVA